MAEFIGIRSKLYKECLQEFPHARDEEINAIKKFLNPRSNETILEVGAGSGLLSEVLSEALKNGKLIVSDPSAEQLQAVKNKPNIQIVNEGTDNLSLEKETVDAVCSLGAMHHCFNKTKAFQNFARVLKPNGRLVIADVFHGSSLAKHFDVQVAKYCITGHEVAFWTDEFTESLCFLTGFEKPKISRLDIHWKFNSKEDIGIFLYKIHAMTKTTPEECLRGAEEILGISKKDNLYYLDWPLKVIVTKKINSKHSL